MGVKELWSVLAPVKQHRPLEELSGKSIAVDLSMWVCEAQSVRQMQGAVTRPYLRNLFFRISNLLQLNVHLVFVLDGTPPELKWETMMKRQQARLGPNAGPRMKTAKPARSHFKAMLRDCCRMLDTLGISYVQSVGEAEAMCALLDKEGVVDGCLTDDGDAFLYGARTVYRNFTLDRKDPHIEVYCMSDIESQLGLNRKKLVAMATLLGCDYVPKGVPGVGREMVIKLMTALKDVDVIDRLREWRNSSFLSEMDRQSMKKKPPHCTTCKHPGSAAQHRHDGCTLCHSSAYCEPNDYDYKCECPWHRMQQRLDTCGVELAVRRKALNTPGFPHEKVFSEFLINKDHIPRKKLMWKQPHMGDFQNFMCDRAEWVLEYGQEKILPLLTLWSMKQIVVGQSASDPSLLKPDSIVKARTRQCVPCYEIKWKKLSYDVITETEYYTTVEREDMVKTCYPELTAVFESLQGTKKKPKSKAKPKQDQALEPTESTRPPENWGIDETTNLLAQCQLTSDYVDRPCHDHLTSTGSIEPRTAISHDEIKVRNGAATELKRIAEKHTQHRCRDFSDEVPLTQRIKTSRKPEQAKGTSVTNKCKPRQVNDSSCVDLADVEDFIANTAEELAVSSAVDKSLVLPDIEGLSLMARVKRNMQTRRLHSASEPLTKPSVKKCKVIRSPRYSDPSHPDVYSAGSLSKARPSVCKEVETTRRPSNHSTISNLPCSTGEDSNGTTDSDLVHGLSRLSVGEVFEDPITEVLGNELVDHNETNVQGGLICPLENDSQDDSVIMYDETPVKVTDCDIPKLDNVLSKTKQNQICSKSVNNQDSGRELRISGLSESPKVMNIPSVESFTPDGKPVSDGDGGGAGLDSDISSQGIYNEKQLENPDRCKLTVNSFHEDSQPTVPSQPLQSHDVTDILDQCFGGADETMNLLPPTWVKPKIKEKKKKIKTKNKPLGQNTQETGAANNPDKGKKPSSKNKENVKCSDSDAREYSKRLPKSDSQKNDFSETLASLDETIVSGSLDYTTLPHSKSQAKNVNIQKSKNVCNESGKNRRLHAKENLPCFTAFQNDVDLTAAQTAKVPCSENAIFPLRKVNKSDDIQSVVDVIYVDTPPSTPGGSMCSEIKKWSTGSTQTSTVPECSPSVSSKGCLENQVSYSDLNSNKYSLIIKGDGEHIECKNDYLRDVKVKEHIWKEYETSESSCTDILSPKVGCDSTLPLPATESVIKNSRSHNWSGNQVGTFSMNFTLLNSTAGSCAEGDSYSCINETEIYKVDASTRKALVSGHREGTATGEHCDQDIFLSETAPMVSMSDTVTQDGTVYESRIYDKHIFMSDTLPMEYVSKSEPDVTSDGVAEDSLYESLQSETVFSDTMPESSEVFEQDTIQA